MVVLGGLPAAAPPLLPRRRKAKAVEKAKVDRRPEDQAEAPEARPARHIRGSVDRDYTVENRILGEGITGSVRVATRRRDGAKRAVKRLAKRDLSVKQLEDLRLEAELHLAVDHPNVVRAEAVYETQNETTFVLPCLDGGDVFDRLIDVGRYKEEDAAVLLRQMLLALNYLHGQGIVHGDVKPENFVHEDASSLRVQLVDFGHAARVGFGKRLTKSGTLLYSAPEAVERNFGPAADMWSLGVVAYVLLCGVLPWRRGSDEDTARAILSMVPHYSETLFEPLSIGAKSFVKGLLCHESVRPSARVCLQNPWLLAMLPEAKPVCSTSLVAPLRSFADASALRRTCALAAAGALADRRSGAARDLFLELDREGRGFLLYKDFRAAIPEAEAEDAELAALFQALNQASNPGISYTEFLAAWQHLDGCCAGATGTPEGQDAAECSGSHSMTGMEAFPAWRCQSEGAGSDHSTEAPLPQQTESSHTVHTVESQESLFSLGMWRATSDDALDGSNTYLF